MTAFPTTLTITTCMSPKLPRTIQAIQDDIQRVSRELDKQDIVPDRDDLQHFLRDLQMELLLAWIPVIVEKIRDMDTRTSEAP